MYICEKINDAMKKRKTYSINIRGQLLILDSPKVMGILNVTPDSFYLNSRKQTDEDITKRIEQLVTEEVDIIDIGGYSTRPNAEDVAPSEEMNRLRRALKIIKEIAPKTIISVDTFRSEVASMCVEEYGADIINDISAGELDANMFSTIARLNVPYILTHMKGTPQDMQQKPSYENIMGEVLPYLAEKVNRLHDMGVKDIIVDPGFGFGKSIEHNYQMMAHLEGFHSLECPLLAGVSRKSMVYRLLEVSPDEALNGTTALHSIALMKGVHILRVHDVTACKQCIKIVENITHNS